MHYEFLKAVHILGLFLFMGNGIVTGFWKALADRTNAPQVVAFAQRMITITDWQFTVGGAALVYASGLGMAHVGGLDPWGESWLVWGHVMFAASGLVWVVALLPLQVKQARMARAFADGGAIPETYWRLSRRWYIWGTIATILALANLYFMIFKP